MPCSCSAWASPAGRGRVDVERGGLVRVLAVAQRRLPRSASPANCGQPSSAGASVPANHSATATSYSAMSANARAASARRWASVNPPSASAPITAGYAAGSVTTATEAWFFAAARTIAGPPMSICSTHSSTSAPDATVAWNG